MKNKKHSPFNHDYPGAAGVTRSDAQGSAGPTPFAHASPGAHHPGGKATNLRGTKRPPLTHRLKKRSRGVTHAAGKRA